MNINIRRAKMLSINIKAEKSHQCKVQRMMKYASPPLKIYYYCIMEIIIAIEKICFTDRSSLLFLSTNSLATHFWSSSGPSLCSVLATLNRTLATESPAIASTVGIINFTASSAPHTSANNCQQTKYQVSSRDN